jgi:hypothetical protein
VASDADKVLEWMRPLADAIGYTGTSTTAIEAALPDVSAPRALNELRQRGDISYRVSDGKIRHIRILFDDQRPTGGAPRAIRGSVKPVGPDVLNPQTYPPVADGGAVITRTHYQAHKGHGGSAVMAWLKDHEGVGVFSEESLKGLGYGYTKNAQPRYSLASRGLIEMKSLGRGTHKWAVSLKGLEPPAPEPEPEPEPEPAGDTASPAITTEELTLSQPMLSVVINLDVSRWDQREVLELIRELRGQ